MSAVLRRRADWAEEEAARLAPYAAQAARSRGRVHEEAEHPYRSAFQRDRDRVVHSRAFRRLEYKTQVFVYHEGDHYRNRLTHTLEGSQIARTIARILRANEDLAEAVVLSHDLGHTPFGHAGERALDELMEDAGGFDHNRQTLRIVDWLEDRYPDFPGLNLTSETREGILKHGCHWEHPVPVPPATPSPSLEAQLADRADEIAYLNHDLDDGLRSGLLTHDALAEVALWCQAREQVVGAAADAREAVVDAGTVRTLVNGLVTDLVEATADRLAQSEPGSIDAVRAFAEPVVAGSAAAEQGRAALKEFLYENLYHHPRVLEMSRRGASVIADLFTLFYEKPALLPSHVRERMAGEGETRAIADYIAGMTDRFALAEHERLEA